MCRVTAEQSEHPTLPAGCLNANSAPPGKDLPCVQLLWATGKMKLLEESDKANTKWLSPPQKGCLKTTGFPEWRMQPEAWTSPWNLLPKMKMLLKFTKKKSQKISKIYLIVQIQDQTIHYQDFTSWPGLEYSVYREETVGNPATPPAFWTSQPGILVLIIAFIYLNWEETAVSFWLGPWPACGRYLTNKD